MYPAAWYFLTNAITAWNAKSLFDVNNFVPFFKISRLSEYGIANISYGASFKWYLSDPIVIL